MMRGAISLNVRMMFRIGVLNCLHIRIVMTCCEGIDPYNDIHDGRYNDQCFLKNVHCLRKKTFFKNHQYLHSNN